MMPAAGASSSYMPLAASGDSSRNGEPGSTSDSTRSLGSSLPTVQVPLPGPLTTPTRGDSGTGPQVVDERGVLFQVPLVAGVTGIGATTQDGRVHVAPLTLVIVNMSDVSAR